MTSEKTFELTIAICTHNRCEQLFENVKKIVDICQSYEWIGILLVDNASTDDTSQVILRLIDYGKLKDIKIKTVCECQLGLAAARNLALDACETEFIAFVDDDAYVSQNWANMIREAFQKNDRLAACGGPVVPVYDVSRPDWLSDRFLWAYSIHDRGKSDQNYVFPDHPLGVNMTFDKKKLQSLRFDQALGRKGTGLLSWEESKFFRELMQRGGLVTYLSEAVVYHVVPPERLTKAWLKKRHEAEGITIAIITLNKNPSTVQFFFKASNAAVRYIMFFFLSVIYPDNHFRFFARMKSVYFSGLLKGLFGNTQG